MTRGIGSSGYNSQVNGANVGSAGNTKPANSVNSDYNTGTTQRGSAIGSFNGDGSVGGANSTGSASEVDIIMCKILMLKDELVSSKEWKDAKFLDSVCAYEAGKADKDGKRTRKEKKELEKWEEKRDAAWKAVWDSDIYHKLCEAANKYKELTGEEYRYL